MYLALSTAVVATVVEFPTEAKTRKIIRNAILLPSEANIGIHSVK